MFLAAAERLCALFLCACLAACGGAPEQRELVVFAASSLREAFGVIGRDFEHAHPSARVRFSFAGSQELRTQLEHGAPADVFASADEKHMTVLANAGHVRPPALFARNEPVVVVRSALTGLQTFDALPDAERIVLGAAEVPIGRYSHEVLARAGTNFRARVEAKVVSRELNVRQVLAKVSLGEADAGIVYRTDAQSGAGRVRIVTIPAALNVIARYPIAPLARSAQPELAAAFVAHVLGPQGQAALQGAGFLPAR
jgi:molybdate transport system substrate-binding protein